MLATRQRFSIFQKLLRKHISSNSVVCSVPCGLMQDLQTLDLPDNVTDVKFVGLDLDQIVMDMSADMAKKTKLRQTSEFFRRDAWDLKEFAEHFDVLTSNGLNIYEADDNRVIDLYRSFFSSLRPGGKLIGSAMSCPPPGDSEWDMSKLNLDHLVFQKMLFTDILMATSNHFRSTDTSIQQLETAGFTDIEIHWDDAKLFYTFEASKHF